MKKRKWFENSLILDKYFSSVENKSREESNTSLFIFLQTIPGDAKSYKWLQFKNLRKSQVSKASSHPMSPKFVQFSIVLHTERCGLLKVAAFDWELPIKNIHICYPIESDSRSNSASNDGRFTWMIRKNYFISPRRLHPLIERSILYVDQWKPKSPWQHCTWGSWRCRWIFLYYRCKRFW